MTKDIDQTKSSFRRLHVDRKMIGILSVFAVLGLCLVITILVATSTLSALRGYASLQTHWTEARKEASMQLVSYFRTRDQQYYHRFEDAVGKIENAQNIRRELLKENKDYGKLYTYFLAINTIPEDIETMTTAFERFHDFPDFKMATNQWVASDNVMQQMKRLAAVNHKFIQQGIDWDDKAEKQAINSVYELDIKLTELQYKLAAALASGTAFLNNVILWVSLSLGFILLATGGFLAFRFLRSVKSWRRIIEISEQQYRSLFEQNPNGVYEISREGTFISGNQAFEHMIGYSIREINGADISAFICDGDLKKVTRHFYRALRGDPQSFEATGIRKNGERIFVLITNLPIYVDGEIIGVYGIVQDISLRKQNELKIREQLEEKTHLLAEIHDRVKNNLALVSSLIRLQRDNSEEKAQQNYLDSTISRIHSMAMVHEHLYQTENFSRIRVDEYLEEFRESFAGFHSDDTEIILDAEEITLGIKQAIPTALLLNELVSNACKYGVNGDGGEVRVALCQEVTDIVLKVEDDGPGLPEQHCLEEPKTLGLRLVSVLIAQLDGEYRLDREEGTSFTITFKNEVIDKEEAITADR